MAASVARWICSLTSVGSRLRNVFTVTVDKLFLHICDEFELKSIDL